MEQDRLQMQVLYCLHIPNLDRTRQRSINENQLAYPARRLYSDVESGCEDFLDAGEPIHQDE